MATKNAVKEHKAIQLAREYTKSQHAFGVIHPAEIEAWLNDTANET